MKTLYLGWLVTGTLLLLGCGDDSGERAASERAANESRTISTLRSLVMAQAMFYQGDLDNNNKNDYASTIKALVDLEFIDEAVATGAKDGYRYALNSTGEHWTCSAEPVTPGTTGTRRFFVNEAGIIRFNLTTTATAADPEVQ